MLINIFKRTKSGFTLIEMLVIMAILGILISITLVNQSQNYDRDVRLEKERLTSFMREVQTKAISGEDVTGAVKICGFGLHYNAGSIEYYYVTVPTNGTCVGQSKLFNTSRGTFTPRNGVAFSGFYTYNENVQDFFFASPTGDVYTIDLNDEVRLSAGSSVVLTSLTKGGSSVDVSISSGGKIY